MARVGLYRLNSEGVAAVQARFQQGRWANVVAFCNAIGIPRSTYYQLIARDKWSEFATLQDKLNALGIPQEDQKQLCEFRDVPTDPLLTTPTGPNNLPLQPTSFIGRETEKATLKQMLASTALLTLTGSGGCGKTRLALEVASELMGRYADGVWLVELAALTDAKLVAQTLLTALGLHEEAGRSPLETAVAFLKPKTLLLILDNCEHLIAACAAVGSAVLGSCAEVKLLATSRTPLQIGGERVWRVPSLPTPDPSVLAAEKEPWGLLLEYDACRLFVERARGHQGDLVISRSSAVSVAGICKRLDGIPLAIELAATRVRSLAVEEIEGHLDHRFRLLTGGSRTVLPRHQTLRALIDWSWELLEAHEQRLLSRLSVFAGGWTLAAAEQVGVGEDTTAEAIEEWDVLDLLTGLVDKSLAIAETQGETTRYHLLETVRQYARDRLAETDEGMSVRQRHRDYFLALAQEAEPKLQGPDQAHWLGVLEEEHDNLRQVLTWCQEEAEGGAAGLRLGAALWRFWFIRGHLSEGRRHLSELLSRPVSPQDLKARADTLNGAGTLTAGQGDYAEARRLHEESQAIFEELGDKQGIANTLRSLGSVAYYQSDHGTARALAEASLVIRRELGDKQGIAQSLNSLATMALNQNDHAAARLLYENALGLNRELGNRAGEANNLFNLAISAGNQGDLRAARTLHMDSLAIQRELGNKSGIAHSLLFLGICAYAQGDYTAARALVEECLAIRRELGDRSGISASLVTLGHVAKDQGDYGAARALYEESLAIRRKLGDKQGIADTLLNLGHVAYYQSDYAVARALLEESLPILQELAGKRGLPYCLYYLGNVAHDQGDYAAARTHYEESLRIRRESGDRQGIAYSLLSLGHLARDLGDYARACLLLAESLTILQELGHRHGISDVLNHLGTVASLQGDHAPARLMLEESLAIRRELGHRRGIAESLGELGLVAEAEGDYAGARAMLMQSLDIRTQLGHKQGIAETLDACASVAYLEREPEGAARLWGAATSLRHAIGSAGTPDKREKRDRQVEQARAALGKAAFAAAFEEGCAMTWVQAVEYVLGESQ